MAAVDELVALFPQVWAGDTAESSGVLYGLLRALSIAMSVNENGAAYAEQQRRILTATQSNLEAIATDFFPTPFPRFTAIVNQTAVQEADPAFGLRISQNIVAPENTIPAIKAAVDAYLKGGFQYDIAIRAQVLGLDTEGSFDGWGALDGRANTVPPIPVVTVFDEQSDPARSALLGVGDGQFAIVLTYGLVALNGFFSDNSHLGDETFLVPPGYKAIAPPTSTLANIVETIKAEGMQPLWFDNNA